MVNGNLGIRAKVEPSVDSNSARKVADDLEEEIQRVENLQFDGDTSGFRGRTMGGGTGGGMGTAAGAGVAGKAASRLGGASALAAGGALLGTVALGGVVAKGMFNAMSNASGRLQAANSMFGEAMSLFFRPFGDEVAGLLLGPGKAALEAMVEFNKTAQSSGLPVALMGLPDGVRSVLAEAVGSGVRESLDVVVGDEAASKAGSAITDALEGYGDLLSGQAVFDFIRKDWPGWDAYLPTIKSGTLVGMTFPTLSAPFVVRSVFDTVPAANIVSRVFAGIDIGADDVLGDIFDDFTIGMNDLLSYITDGGSESGGDRDNRQTGGSRDPPIGNRPGGPSSPVGGDSGSSGGADINNVPPYIRNKMNFSVNLSGRRVEGVTKDERNERLNMVGGN